MLYNIYDSNILFNENMQPIFLKISIQENISFVLTDYVKKFSDFNRL